jgi:hypothetical protein
MIYLDEVKMTLLSIASLAEEPGACIVRWRVPKINDGTRHFVGVDDRHLSGRVSSAIVAFDNQTLRGRTLSGRIYQLTGNPGRSKCADYVWQQWCAGNEVASFAGVTEQLFAGVADDNLQ